MQTEYYYNQPICTNLIIDGIELAIDADFYFVEQTTRTLHGSYQESFLEKIEIDSIYDEMEEKDYTDKYKENKRILGFLEKEAEKVRNIRNSHWS